MPIDREYRVFYLSPKMDVISHRELNGVVIILRSEGEPSEEDIKEINRVLKLCNMSLEGDSSFLNKRWYQPVKEREVVNG